jgi:hypothetical protein
MPARDQAGTSENRPWHEPNLAKITPQMGQKLRSVYLMSLLSSSAKDKKHLETDTQNIFIIDKRQVPFLPSVSSRCITRYYYYT